MSKQDEWENENKIDVRTRVAIKILFFIFKVLSPYRFAASFEKELKMLQEELDKL
jgi:hypothetical protein